MGLINEVKSTLDAINTKLKAIDAPLHADETFLDRSQAHLDVVNILRQTVDLPVDAA